MVSVTEVLRTRRVDSQECKPAASIKQKVMKTINYDSTEDRGISVRYRKKLLRWVGRERRRQTGGGCVIVCLTCWEGEG